MDVSRRDFIQATLLGGAALTPSDCRPGEDGRAAEGPRPTLWYQRPASAWTEALPAGNGRLGAMVFGGVEEERIQLNLDSLWGGSPLDRERAVSPGALQRARELWFAGQVTAAQRIMQEEFMKSAHSPERVRSGPDGRNLHTQQGVRLRTIA